MLVYDPQSCVFGLHTIFAVKCVLIKKSVHEKQAGSLMKHATISCYLIYLPFFEQHISSTHLQWFGDVLVRVCHMRGNSGSLQGVVLVKSPQEQVRTKTDSTMNFCHPAMFFRCGSVV